MVAPGSLGDWMLFTGMLGALSALAVVGHTWVLQGAVTPDPIRSHPLVAPRTAQHRVPT
jgi:pheromone shutdown protein TraB